MATETTKKKAVKNAAQKAPAKQGTKTGKAAAASKKTVKAKAPPVLTEEIPAATEAATRIDLSPVYPPTKLTREKFERFTEASPPEKPVAVVVGASSGIGYRTALALAQNGYTVYNLARTECDRRHIQSLRVDAERPGEIFTAIQSVAQREGSIDALVYSAGRSLAAPLEHIAEEDFRRIFEVNYFGLVEALRAVVPVMREKRRGRIVAVSSMAGTSPIPFDAPYSASKAAIDITLRALAIELKPYNIKVTGVQPGGVCTRFTQKRKVYPAAEVGEYARAMDKAVNKLCEMEQGGMDPRAVADCIAALINKENPPVSTAVGIKNKASRLACKILPSAIADYFNRMMFEQ